MQADMAKVQDELATTVVAGSAGGDAITVEVTCDQRVRSVTMSKEAVDPDDIETLEDLIVVAVNDALAKAVAESQKRMSAVTGSMRIPGIS